MTRQEEDALAASVTVGTMSHEHPDGSPVASAVLKDGRTIRCVGAVDGRSAQSELRAWLLWIALSVLVGCGGPEFEVAGVTEGLEAGMGEAAVEWDAAQDAPAEAADAGGGDSGRAASDGGGEADGATGETGAQEACASVTHSDGIGDAWQDCTALGTLDAQQAWSACGANVQSGGGANCAPHTCADSNLAICDTDLAYPGYCTCWTYAGPFAGHVDSYSCDLDAGGPWCGGGVTWQ